MVALMSLLVLLLVAVPSGYAAPAPGTLYYILIDNTASLAPAEFERYPEVVRRAVLEVLRGRDAVVIASLAPAEGESAVSIALDGGRRGRRKAIRQLDEAVQKIQLSKNRNGSTDIGKVFTQIGGGIGLERHISTAALPPIRALVLTDGLATGRQSRLDWAGDVGLDLKIAFVGIHPEARERLAKSCNDAGFRRPDQLLFVDLDHLSQAVSRLPDFFERSVNQELHRELARANTREEAEGDER